MIGQLVGWLADTSSGDPIVDWITRAGPVGVLAFVLVLFAIVKLVTR